jgi:Phage portal protein
MGLLDRAIASITGQRSTEVTVQQDSPFGKIGGFSISMKSNAGINTYKPTREEALACSPVASRAVDLIVGQGAAQEIQIVDINGEEVEDHYIEQLWNESPNADQSALSFKTTLLTRIVLTGQAFVILDRGANRVDDPTSATIAFGKVQIGLTDPTPAHPQNPGRRQMVHPSPIRGALATR